MLIFIFGILSIVFFSCDFVSVSFYDISTVGIFGIEFYNIWLASLKSIFIDLLLLWVFASGKTLCDLLTFSSFISMKFSIPPLALRYQSSSASSFCIFEADYSKISSFVSELDYSCVFCYCGSSFLKDDVNVEARSRFEMLFLSLLATSGFRLLSFIFTLNFFILSESSLRGLSFSILNVI